MSRMRNTSKYFQIWINHKTKIMDLWQSKINWNKFKISFKIKSNFKSKKLMNKIVIYQDFWTDLENYKNQLHNHNQKHQVLDNNILLVSMIKHQIKHPTIEWFKVFLLYQNKPHHNNFLSRYNCFQQIVQ